MRFTEVCLLDHCTSSYFTGYHMPVIQVAVWGSLTHLEVAEAILEEINFTFDYLCDTESGYTEEEVKLFEGYCEELMKTPDAVFVESEIIEDNEDTSWLYFALCKPVIIHGITFRNP
jgi:hypothetical protein